MKYNQVRYILNSEVKGKKVITEPRNWNNVQRKNFRSEDGFGTFTELSEQLELVKDAYRYVVNIYEAYGTQIDITITREVKSGISNWEVDYFGNLDLKTIDYDDIVCKINILTGGLKSLIDSQWNEEYELEREKDIDGNDISPVTDYNVPFYWEGRRILIESKLEESQKETGLTYVTPMSIIKNAVPLNVVYTAFNKAFSQINNSIFFSDDYSASRIFYLSKTDNTQVNVNINGSSYINSDIQNALTNSDSRQLRIRLFKVQTDSDLSTFNTIETISETALFGDECNVGNTISFSFDDVVDLEENQALSLCFQIAASFENDPTRQYSVGLTNNDYDVLAFENSFFEGGYYNKGFRLYNAWQRMTEILTGDKTLFKSNYLNEGEFKNMVIHSGDSLRNDPETKTTLSLEMLYKAQCYTEPLGWGVELIDGKRYLRVEPKSYFADVSNVINLGEVANLSQKANNDKLYKSLVFGADVGEYESGIGKTEINTLNTYGTPLTKAESIYEQKSEIRADAVGAEIQRRKPYSQNKNEDGKFDKDIFLFDCKYSPPFYLNPDGIFQPRKWQDDFSTEPDVYDPESAINLRITPFRCAIRHAKMYIGAMRYYQDKSIRYKSTQIIADAEIDGLQEDGDVSISELQNHLIDAVNYNCEVKKTKEIKQLLRGRTSGKNNLNYLFTFVYKGQRYTGFLNSIVENDKLEIELIKY